MTEPLSRFTIPKKARVEVPQPSPIISDGFKKRLATQKETEEIISKLFLNDPEQRPKWNCMKATKIELIENPKMEQKFLAYKKRVQPNEEFYGYRAVYEDDEIRSISANGLSVKTDLFGDIGDPSKGVVMYNTPAVAHPVPIILKNIPITIMMFRTVRGKAFEVSLGAGTAHPNKENNCHIPKNVPRKSGEIRPIYVRRAGAVYHYEHSANGYVIQENLTMLLPHALITFEAQGNPTKEMKVFAPITLEKPFLFFVKGNKKSAILQSLHPNSHSSGLLFDRHIDPEVYSIKEIDNHPVLKSIQKNAHTGNLLNSNEHRINPGEVTGMVSYYLLRLQCNETVSKLLNETCRFMKWSEDNTTLFFLPSGRVASEFGLPYIPDALHLVMFVKNEKKTAINVDTRLKQTGPLTSFKHYIEDENGELSKKNSVSVIVPHVPLVNRVQKKGILRTAGQAPRDLRVKFRENIVDIRHFSEHDQSVQPPIVAPPPVVQQIEKPPTAEDIEEKEGRDNLFADAMAQNQQSRLQKNPPDLATFVPPPGPLNRQMGKHSNGSRTSQEFARGGPGGSGPPRSPMYPSNQRAPGTQAVAEMSKGPGIEGPAGRKGQMGPGEQAKQNSHFLSSAQGNSRGPQGSGRLMELEGHAGQRTMVSPPGNNRIGSGPAGSRDPRLSGRPQFKEQPRDFRTNKDQGVPRAPLASSGAEIPTDPRRREPPRFQQNPAQALSLSFTNTASLKQVPPVAFALHGMPPPFSMAHSGPPIDPRHRPPVPHDFDPLRPPPTMPSNLRPPSPSLVPPPQFPILAQPPVVQKESREQNASGDIGEAPMDLSLDEIHEDDDEMNENKDDQESHHPEEENEILKMAFSQVKPLEATPSTSSASTSSTASETIKSLNPETKEIIALLAGSKPASSSQDTDLRASSGVAFSIEKPKQVHVNQRVNVFGEEEDEDDEKSAESSVRGSKDKDYRNLSSLPRSNSHFPKDVDDRFDNIPLPKTPSAEVEGLKKLSDEMHGRLRANAKQIEQKVHTTVQMHSPAYQQFQVVGPSVSSPLLEGGFIFPTLSGFRMKSGKLVEKCELDTTGNAAKRTSSESNSSEPNVESKRSKVPAEDEEPAEPDESTYQPKTFMNQQTCVMMPTESKEGYSTYHGEGTSTSMKSGNSTTPHTKNPRDHDSVGTGKADQLAKKSWDSALFEKPRKTEKDKEDGEINSDEEPEKSEKSASMAQIRANVPATPPGITNHENPYFRAINQPHNGPVYRQPAYGRGRGAPRGYNHFTGNQPHRVQNESRHTDYLNEMLPVDSAENCYSIFFDCDFKDTLNPCQLNRFIEQLSNTSKVRIDVGSGIHFRIYVHDYVYDQLIDNKNRAMSPFYHTFRNYMDTKLVVVLGRHSCDDHRDSNKLAACMQQVNTKQGAKEAIYISQTIKPSDEVHRDLRAHHIQVMTIQLFTSYMLEKHDLVL
ncbi:unnamed protein product [Caenorhabditis sp. 36 PRJEB53466]|nr:unnamed protein product [Caenorhabditis sp. 36 PRJEB53466]